MAKKRRAERGGPVPTKRKAIWVKNAMSVLVESIDADAGTVTVLWRVGDGGITRQELEVRDVLKGHLELTLPFPFVKIAMNDIEFKEPTWP